MSEKQRETTISQSCMGEIRSVDECLRCVLRGSNCLVFSLYVQGFYSKIM